MRHAHSDHVLLRELQHQPALRCSRAEKRHRCRSKRPVGKALPLRSPVRYGCTLQRMCSDNFQVLLMSRSLTRQRWRRLLINRHAVTGTTGRSEANPRREHLGSTGYRGWIRATMDQTVNRRRLPDCCRAWIWSRGLGLLKSGISEELEWSLVNLTKQVNERWKENLTFCFFGCTVYARGEKKPAGAGSYVWVVMGILSPTVALL